MKTATPTNNRAQMINGPGKLWAARDIERNEPTDSWKPAPALGIHPPRKKTKTYPDDEENMSFKRETSTSQISTSAGRGKEHVT